uniref:Uncharacterized protein n=1 Tax=Amycolatopsis orientalis subsp. vinearia TaxID=797057 RepID=A0A023GXN1_AMYOR|nr:hypothetical protein [Amycolatopsis orientalis subsp. vinearia]
MARSAPARRARCGGGSPAGGQRRARCAETLVDDLVTRPGQRVAFVGGAPCRRKGAPPCAEAVRLP